MPRQAAPSQGRAAPDRVVLVAHGSPDPRHRDGVTGIADRLAERLGSEVVASYLEHDLPTAAAAVAEAERTGGTTCVLPLLFAGGFHWENDIRPILSTGAPSITLREPPPLELFARGIAGLAAERRPADLVVAAAGSRSPRLQQRLAALVDVVRQSASVEVSFAASPDAVRTCAGPGTLVVPLLVADGVFGDRIRHAAAQVRAEATPVFGATSWYTAALAEYAA